MERDIASKPESKTTGEAGHKIHKTHFPVIKIPLKSDGHESSYEWVPSGNGRLKRVPKKADVEKTPPPQLTTPQSRSI